MDSARVEVMRAFRWQGVVVVPGEFLFMSVPSAAEQVSAGRARYAPEEAPGEPVAEDPLPSTDLT